MGAFQGCGRGQIRATSVGTSKGWRPPELKPQGFLGAQQELAFSLIDCADMPEESKVLKELKPVLPAIHKICGTDVLVASHGNGYDVERTALDRYRRSAQISCYIRTSHHWFAGPLKRP